jgi:2-polyprenyl-3-methyl-5-hydroxy-6-metoxy-1,4-benzoquinol methylase
LDSDGDGLRATQDAVDAATRRYYHSPVQQGIDNRLKRLLIERCMPHLRGPDVLDLGYIDGTWTDAILARGHRVHVVEGAGTHVEHARRRYAGRPDVRVSQSLFERFDPGGRYDTVVAGDMLSLLADPVAFLATAANWLADHGVLIVTVPNSRSLHRRLGAVMDLEPTPAAVNQQYRDVGNRWSYDRYLLRHQLLSAGLAVSTLEGFFLKPLPSERIQDWDDDLIRGFVDLGDELQDYCYYLYAICRRAA